MADYSQQQNDIYARRQEGTAVWFLEAHEYLRWARGATPTLVCPGQPGAGKSVVAATVVHELLHSEDVTSVGMTYLFCNYKRQDEQDTPHFLAALSRQLLRQMDAVPGPLRDMFTKHKARNTRPSQGELWDALLSLARAFKKVYVIIDALDECEREVCSELLSMIRRLQDTSNVSLLVTTRPLREVLDHVPSYPLLEVRASKSDVDIYLRARMQTLPKFVRTDQTLQDQIVKAVVSAVDGM